MTSFSLKVERSVPLNSIWPDVGLSIKEIKFKKVDFPDPDFPLMQTSPLLGRQTLIFLSALKDSLLSRAYSLFTFLNSKILIKSPLFI